LDFDATFSAMAARRPIGSLPGFLAHFDAHPPLDYLLRHPLAVHGVSDGWIRLPSAVFSIAALVVFAVWMRRRDRLGAVATWLLALSPFAIVYAREARMHALMGLVGVSAAVLADRWLSHG